MGDLARGLHLAVSRIARTTTRTGTSVAKSEGKLDRAVFDDPEAGVVNEEEAIHLPAQPSAQNV